MKVMLLKDVYKLGRAGDVKRVANGYGRNYLIPQGMAVLATPAALSQAEHIRTRAQKERAILNNEMSAVAAQLEGVTLFFPSKAGETGKLYGSITSQMIADAINEKIGGDVISHHNVDTQPIRTLGEHKAEIRLTVDLIPEIDILVYREGETPAALAAGETPEEEEEIIEVEEDVEFVYDDSDDESEYDEEFDEEYDED